MPQSSPRRLASALLFALGSVWGVAGAFKLLFGTRLTVPFLPPLGLEQVAAVPAVLVAVGCFAVAAWLGRTTSSSLASGERDELLGEPGVDLPPASPRRRADTQSRIAIRQRGER